MLLGDRKGVVGGKKKKRKWERRNGIAEGGETIALITGSIYTYVLFFLSLVPRGNR